MFKKKKSKHFLNFLTAKIKLLTPVQIIFIFCFYFFLLDSHYRTVFLILAMGIAFRALSCIIIHFLALDFDTTCCACNEEVGLEEVGLLPNSVQAKVPRPLNT